MSDSVRPHSSTLAWQIPWAEEPGGLQSMGSLRVGHDWVTSLSLFTFMHWTRKWQPTPVFLPGESQGWGNLVGCHLWGHTESNMTEATWQHRELYSISCNNLQWKIIYIYIHITESLCQTPKTNTILQINYNSIFKSRKMIISLRDSPLLFVLCAIFY